MPICFQSKISLCMYKSNALSFICNIYLTNQTQNALQIEPSSHATYKRPIQTLFVPKPSYNAVFINMHTIP